MDINKALADKQKERIEVALNANSVFRPFMDAWLKMDQKNWNVQAHAVRNGFFVYHYGRTVASISCREGRVEVDHSGAYDLGLEPPEAVHGVWPPWVRTVTIDVLNGITDRLLDYIAKRP